jgi:HK97 family phage major capsid protein
MSPRTFLHMADMRDSNGNLIYPGLQLATPLWRSKRVFVTTQTPINLGSGTDESEILLVAFPEVYYGEGTQITFTVSTEASYTSGGSTVSAFQNDLTLIKASAEADVDMRYLEAVVVGDAVRWGA